MCDGVNIRYNPFLLHVLHFSDDSIDCEEELMVNSDIVDNEFTGRDVSVSFSFRDWKIRITNPLLLFYAHLVTKWKWTLENAIRR